MVIVATVGSVICLTGPDDAELQLEPMLSSYKNQTEKVKEIPMPKGYQCLTHVCYSKLMKRPTAILWSNGNTLISLRLPEPNDAVTDGFLSARNAMQKLKFAKKDDADGKVGMQDHPLAVGLTDFHYYLLFQDSITILSTITQKVIVHAQDDFKGGLISDMAYDRSSATFWIFSNKGVIKLDTSKEGTQAWKLLIEEKKYKEAYNVCKAKNENISYAAGLYAEDLFARREYERAAQYFS